MLNNILQYAIKNDCSDVHIISGQQPMVRFNGDMTRIANSPILKRDQVEKIISSLLNEAQIEKFNKNYEIDFAFELKSHVRFRANVFKTLSGPAIAFRPINEKVKTLDEIFAPKIIEELLKKRRGLIILSGPTGCGKSTTLSAMIDYINCNHSCNIITIEDPIEYVHKSKKSLVSQREVGIHTNSFANALRSSLRENPDIILIGELRDLETISLALTAAETGHLVLATLHSSSSVNAISRIIDVFAPQEQMTVRSMLANSLNAVILQRLLKTKDNSQQAAFEVMVGNSSARNLIREDKLAQIQSMLEIGKRHGMITMKDSIVEMLNQGLISEETANESIASFS